MHPITDTTIVEKTDHLPSQKNINSFEERVTEDYNAQPEVQMKELPIQFTSVLAHEIRNPLTNINMSIEILESGLENEPQQYLDIIKRSSARINELINELVKYQLADEAPPGKYSIHQLLDEVLNMAKDRLKLKNITVIRDYTENDFEIVLKRPKMKIALTNIIINAVDAMPQENGRLTLVTRSMAGKFILHIEDNGCGISKKNLKNIFRPYFTNKPGGLGLGLTSTYDILRSNHIGILIDSKVGKGTSFKLAFRKYPIFNLISKQ